MKDGVIEQLDTPANIVMNPATEYVRKFTEEVPREKVLKIESVMEPVNPADTFDDISVSKDAVIETVAEVVLNSSKPVSVVNSAGEVVGAVRASKLVSLLFGGHSQVTSDRAS